MYYTLHTRNTKECLGVYTSIRHCSKGLDIFLNEEENLSDTYYYMTWEANTLYPESWEWAYIAPSATVEDLKSGGSDFIPAKEHWGENIIEVEWEEID